MAIYVGINGVPKKTSAMYVGVNGVPKKVKTAYSSENGTIKKVLRTKITTTDTQSGEQIFTSSGAFTVPTGCTSITVFCVGGGGDGRMGRDETNYSEGGIGGGGGYTKTSALSVSAGDNVSIAIGANGGITSAGSVISYPGGVAYGGSGGGQGSCFDGNTQRWVYPSSGGYDGGNGGVSYLYADGGAIIEDRIGRGQGSTTRAFGESNGTLYSGGGGGGVILKHSAYGMQSGGPGGGGNGAYYSGTWLIEATAGSYATGGGGGGARGSSTKSGGRE